MTSTTALTTRRITHLKPEGRDRVRVFLDGTAVTSLHVLLAKELKVGEFFSIEQQAALDAADAPYRARGVALRFLSVRARSRAEVARYLGGKGYGDAVVSEVMEKLAQERVLDDAEFSREWVESRMRHRPKSGRALAWELRQKGVAAEVIHQATDPLDEAAAAWAAVVPKLRQWAGLDNAEFQAKLYPFLQRRGFSHEVCRTTLQRAWQNQAETRENSP